MCLRREKGCCLSTFFPLCVLYPFFFVLAMGGEYEPTRFALGHEKRGHNEYFDITTSVLGLRPILFEDEWRAIDSIEDDVERRRRESEQLLIVLATMMAQLYYELFVKSRYIEEDYVQVRIESDNLPIGSIISAIVLVGNFRADNVFHQIQHVLNSQQEVTVRDPSLRIIVEHVLTSRETGHLASERVKKQLFARL